MSSNAVRLEAVNLCIRRGDETIVEGFNWTHSPGRVAWVTGPNGVGKSSLMRVLGGSASPHAGEVRRQRLGGHPRETVSFYSPSMGLPPESRAASFMDMCSRLVPTVIPLSPGRELRSKRSSSLSTGEEKRLLLGPILASRRPFLFLDEPYEHLSKEARAELTEKLLGLAETSVVVVATNQPIPDKAAGPVITLSLDEAPIVS